MFEEWGFLLTEIWVLLALAALVGLIAGWLIWGGRPKADMGMGEADRVRDDLRKCRAREAELGAKIAALTAQNDAPPAKVPDVVDDFAQDTVVGDTAVGGMKPATLDGPRDGMADDLKMIKGVGLKMETLCNALGFWHFEQIAAWTPQEVAWVDANLEGFKGRVTRDDWVKQAKVLSTGGITEFSTRVGKGDVY